MGGAESNVGDSLIIHRGSGLFELDELHIEDEGGVGRDHARVATGAIGVVWRAGEGGTFSDAHLGHTFVPSLDDFSLADDKLERLSAVPGGIKLLPIGEGARVVDYNGLSVAGIGGLISLRCRLHVNAHD